MERRSKTPHDLVFLPTTELPILERIRRLSWQDFEDFIAEVYRGEGYHVEQAARGRADGGYDLVLLRENTSVLVQCKHWLVYQVGVPRIRELAGAMQKVGATGGVFVTTGVFTKPYSMGNCSITRGILSAVRPLGRKPNSLRSPARAYLNRFSGSAQARLRN